MQLTIFNHLTIFWLVSALFLSPFTLKGQIGSYFITNFSEKEYDMKGQTTSPQNWSIVQDDLGLILIANTMGVLEFDGISWRMVPGTEFQYIFELHQDQAGRIYAGGDSDLGYLAPDSTGAYSFYSLRHRLPVDEDEFSPLKSIVSTKNHIYFRSDKEILQWDGDKFHKWESRTDYEGIFVEQDVVYVQQRELGMFRLEGDSLLLMPWSNSLKNVEIRAISPMSTENNDLLIFTRHDGIFLLESDSLSTLANGFNFDIYEVQKLDEKRYAVATTGQGIKIIDESGFVLESINTENGLLSDNVNSLQLDQDLGLWAGLERGISRIECFTPIKLINSKYGLDGIITSVLSTENAIWAGALDGIYKATCLSSTCSPMFSALPGLHSEVWDIKQGRGLVLIATSSGLYQVIDNKLSLISEKSANKISFSKQNDGLAYIGLFEGLATISYQQNRWHWDGLVDNIDHEIRSIYESGQNELWVGHQKISKIDLPLQRDSINKVQELTEAHGFADSLGYFEVFNIDDAIYFGTVRGIFKYHEDDHILKPAEEFGQSFSDGSRDALAIAIDSSNGIWVNSKRRTGTFVLNSENTYDWDSLAFSRIPFTDVWNIIPDENGIIWLATNDGIYHLDRKVDKNYSRPYNTLIRKATLDIDSAIFLGTSLKENGMVVNQASTIANIPHKNRDISFEFTATSYDGYQENQFSYKLEGYDEDWSPWSKETKKEYTSLWEGDYTFKVRSKNVYGTIGKTASYQFSILPPFYRTWWAYSIYAILLIGLVYSFTKYHLSRHKKKLAEQYLLNQRLMQADRLKDAFLANTSHELRTPLNGIIGIAESLKDGVAGKPTAKMREDLSMLVASGKRLSSMVNSILDFSKLKTHDLVLHQRPVDLHSAVEVVFTMCEPLVRGKNLTLDNRVEPQLPMVFADEDRLQQILHNLIGNAIKFTEQGQVSVSAEKTNSLIAVTISDSGIGIPEDKIDLIFKEFEQADASTTRKFVGTGLGLSITKQLVELHGGTINVKSKGGQGTSFTFTLPQSTEQPAQQSYLSKREIPDITPSNEAIPDVSPASNINNNDTINILIVDDEPVNQTVVRNFLSTGLFTLTSALNGKEALDLINRRSYDMVLLDIMMPQMSGFEVCRRIRQKYQPNELPVIMITARDQVRDLVEGLSTGANDYITKPFDKDEFLARIKTHLNLYKINSAYGRFVPHEFLEVLGRESIIDIRLGDQVQGEVTVLFSDIRGYSTLSEGMTPEENFNFLNAYLSRVGPVIKEHQGFINQFLGDGVMALFRYSAEDALKAAIAIQQRVRKYNDQRKADGRAPLAVGIGLHTGPLMLGIIGDEGRMDAGVVSDTVNTASRMEGLTKHYGASIVLSRDTFEDLPAESLINYRALGKVKVKGKLKAVDIFEFYGGRSEEMIELMSKTKKDFEGGLEKYYHKDFIGAAASFNAVLKLIPSDKAAQLYLERAAEYMVKGVPNDWNGIETMYHS